MYVAVCRYHWTEVVDPNAMCIYGHVEEAVDRNRFD